MCVHTSSGKARQLILDSGDLRYAMRRGTAVCSVARALPLKIEQTHQYNTYTYTYIHIYTHTHTYTYTHTHTHRHAHTCARLYVLLRLAAHMLSSSAPTMCLTCYLLELLTCFLSHLPCCSFKLLLTCYLPHLPCCFLLLTLACYLLQLTTPTMCLR